MSAHYRGGNRAAFVVRLLLFVLLAVLVAACGKEATPRVALPTVAPASATDPATPRPQPSPGSAAPKLAEARGLGDPNAPIQVVEYGDYQ
jgi:protein-disulfide isomerase